MQRRLKLILLLAITLILAAGAWWMFYDGYPSAIEEQLRGDLTQIAFQSEYGGDPISVTDPAEMESIRAAVLAAKELPLASWPATVCSLTFHLEGGRSVALKMSRTDFRDVDSEALQPDHGEFATYVILAWNGYLRGADAKPFVGILRKQP